MKPLVDPDADYLAAPCPRIFWIELTSKCPFDCIFCSRALRRGAGKHLDLGLFGTLMAELDAPEVIRLNYSGESIHYPHLVEAIRLARQTGAQTELVTALASAPPDLIRQVVQSGLDRLTISLHTMDPLQYREVYGFGSLELLQDRVALLLETKRALARETPRVDLAFVAMRQNLAQLPAVVRYAERVGVTQVFVHPVLRRDPIPFVFAEELESGRMRPEFRAALKQAVHTASLGSGVTVTVSNPDFEAAPQLGRTAAYYPAELPSGARILTCDQNPWETVHILANGDVVVCEVQDRTPLGNLRQQSLREIWGGEAYRSFRRRYLGGEIEACRTCPWKMAYQPGTLCPAITSSEGMSPQLLRGWHGIDASRTLWSKRESWVILGNRPGGTLRLHGVLPYGPDGRENMLEIIANGRTIGEVFNPTPRYLTFHASLGPLPPGDALHLRFATRTSFNPSRSGINRDTRELGFALFHLEVAS